MKFIQSASVLALAIGALATPVAALAQATDVPVTSEPAPSSAQSPATDAPTANTIVVLGTRRTDRTVTDTASPVDVISSAELKSQPAADMLEVLKNIVPSFYVGQNTISDASTFVRAPSLRGLPGDMTLVMLNGKRFNRSALVQVATGGDTALSFGSQGADLSLLPTIGFSNLQVLREGATAFYGSDAIAGVLDYTLRKDAGIELTGRYGQYYDNGGDGKSRQVAGYAGVNLGDKGYISASGEYNKDGGTSRGVTRPNALLFAQAHPDLASQIPNYPDPAQIWGNSPTRGWKALVNAGYDITPTSQLYLFANFAHSKATESFNYRQVEAFTAVDTAGVAHNLAPNAAFAHPIYLTPCPGGNPTCPAGGFVEDGNTFSFTSLYPAGFTPQFVGNKYQAYGVLGWKGSIIPEFKFDVSGTLSRNTLKLSMYDSLSPSFGPDTQTSFQFGKLIQQEFDANADFTYDADVGLASPLTVAFGGEYRHENYTATPGDLQSYGVGPYVSQPLYIETAPGLYAFDQTVGLPTGASGYGGTSPQAAGTFKQDSAAVYMDLEADVTSTLSVGAAGRYEHYDSFGGAKVGKLNALWKITPALSVRGTVGTGFHAPSPGQSNVEILTTAFTNGVQVQTGTYPVSSSIAQYYGAQALKPEKSTNFGLGAVFNPAPDFTLTVDAYQIKVNNRIGISQTFHVSAADIAAQPALQAVGEGGDVQYFTNAFDTRTRGIDVVATYRLDLAARPLNLTLAYNYNKAKVTSYDPDIISAAQIEDIVHISPNHRATFSGAYSIGPFAITARENYYGWWRDEEDFPGQRFNAKFTTDIDVSYTFMQRFTISGGATNLFNTFPEKIKATPTNPIYVITGGLNNGLVYPSTGGPFGSNGGFWYARLRVKY